MNIIDKFKSLDKNSKWTIILSLTVIILLIINLSVSIGYILDYNRSRKSGDDKWKMFAGMIEDYNRRIDSIEERMTIIDGIVEENR